jgi:hypothetical protein
MDCKALQAQVAQHGPRLIHWVAAVPDAAAACAALAAQGLERGEILSASRATPQGRCNGASPCARTANACWTVACPHSSNGAHSTPAIPCPKAAYACSRWNYVTPRPPP